MIETILIIYLMLILIPLGIALLITCWGLSVMAIKEVFGKEDTQND